MANLKKNAIVLVKEVKEGEIVTETYYTPAFIPLSVVYQAIDLSKEMGKVTVDTEKEIIDKMVDFVAKDIYKNQFTKEDLINGLHAPEAIQTLREQVIFITRGQQTDEVKKLLEKKN
ncbi:phage tail assembly chaperone G [Bacillus sp. Au-Bac7]|uniref:phage tail assembly chaperone G n=1 Tax=Bacillus sp. Au-Bac7 TaxID=2906458 RepID=UPI001E33494C|nr:hypothetical protein [Bacillus sp. Au-Bac7]MCE4052027.1 hypothetical protein [Bacillus sp. Au-Bac7]